MSSLKERVYTSNDRAVENGYVENFEQSGHDIYHVEPLRLAIDAMDSDADLEDEDLDAVVAACADWQRDRRPA